MPREKWIKKRIDAYLILETEISENIFPIDVSVVYFNRLFIRYLHLVRTLDFCGFVPPHPPLRNYAICIGQICIILWAYADRTAPF